MPIGIPATSQTFTSNEVPVGIGLIPSSDVGGVQPATSSIERRDTWASTMAVSWPGMPLANLFVLFLARYLLKLALIFISALH
jgi:hypothetical protein